MASSANMKAGSSLTEKRLKMQQQAGKPNPWRDPTPFNDVTNLFDSNQRVKFGEKAAIKPSTAAGRFGAGTQSRFGGYSAAGSRTRLASAPTEKSDIGARQLPSFAPTEKSDIGARPRVASAAAPPLPGAFEVFNDVPARPPQPAPAAVQDAPRLGAGGSIGAAQLDVEMGRSPSPDRRPTVATSDPQQVAEYSSDIFKLLSMKEDSDTCQPNYMDGQSDINGKMRAILVDWLVEVHLKFKMRTETLFLTVSIIDRFLAKAIVSRKKLQLVGVSALFIASKYEEIYPREVQELAYITDHAYTKDEICDMEVKILCVLSFDVCTPTAAHLLDRYMTANEADAEQQSVIQYIVELALPEISMLQYKASQVVAAACLLSNQLAGRNAVWSAEMKTLTKQSELSLAPCVKELQALLEHSSTGGHKLKLQAVWKKFSQSRFHAVATKLSVV